MFYIKSALAIAGGSEADLDGEVRLSDGSSAGLSD